MLPLKKEQDGVISKTKKRGVDVELQDLVTAMRERDRIDSTRSIAPLKPAEDALIIDTTHKTVEEVVEEILGKIKLSGLERNSTYIHP